jgi:hypothetical protein
MSLTIVLIQLTLKFEARLELKETTLDQPVSYITTVGLV